MLENSGELFGTAGRTHVAMITGERRLRGVPSSCIHRIPVE